jgi:hypothetical protein
VVRRLLSQWLVALRRLPVAARWEQTCRLTQHGALRVAEAAPDTAHHAAELTHQMAAVVATLRERTMYLAMYLAGAALAAELTPALALVEILLDPPQGRAVACDPRISSATAAATPGIVALRRVRRIDQPRVLTQGLAGGATHELGLRRRRRQRWRRLGGCPGE